VPTAARPVTLTTDAATLVKDIFRQRGDKTPHLRIYVAGGCGECGAVGYGMVVVAAPREHDMVITSRGVKVVLDPTSAEYITGARLEVVQTDEGPWFHIDNPSVNAQCTCQH
jgi:iron-sulfur cluster assembly accessory protein